MPIRINLLAEAQALEELRRRDPVKRAILVAGFLVGLMAIWCVLLQIATMRDDDKLKGLGAESKSKESNYQQVINNQKKLVETDQKRTALRQLAASRFLTANVLNALQHTTVDDVQLVHLKVTQQYTSNPEIPAKTNETRTIARTPPTVTEKIILTLDGKDSSTRGEQHNKFKEALANEPYFQKALGKTNETNIKLMNLQRQIGDLGKEQMVFSFECRYPEMTR